WLLDAVNDCRRFFMTNEQPWAADEPEAQDLFAYLASLDATEADARPVALTILSYPIPTPPAGDAGRGAGVYAGACGGCHGELHTGAGRLAATAPVMPEQVLAEHPEPEFLPSQQR